MKPATDWKEAATADEAARFERYAEELRALQRQRAAGRKTSRGLHAKGNAGLEAEFTVCMPTFTIGAGGCLLASAGDPHVIGRLVDTSASGAVGIACRLTRDRSCRPS